ncbi:hypothetical protein [Amycolatopsis rifamycinica]|uniref:Uncharacterized protein n=1 Tax=Amycolatopsis rifamycinica TaxID=287986 RepID=A0A066UIF2_9PSEU|nr:hypothetical protein [Amycolatopsis rifamycinica]KDN24018.1 hypothetical protein DV20_01115 [Amycolatopsis rifamycinica]
MAVSLDSLKPQLIGRSFGRNRLLTGSARPLRAKAGFNSFGVSAALVILALAGQQQVLITTSEEPSAIAAVVRAPARFDGIGMPLLQDPVALVVLFTALATPLFCLEQVESIRDFIPMTVRNIGDGVPHFDPREVQVLIMRANRRFRRIGAKKVSLSLFVVSGIGAYFLLRYLQTGGLLAGWNPVPGRTEPWRAAVYAGWWANGGAHPVMAVLLWLLGAYMFYFVFKQLLMGLIFAVFAQTATTVGFGVTPHLRANIDGYWGLRTLRRFMQWTYGSTLAHFVTTLGVCIVWLPFTQWTFFIVTAVMIVNSTLVIYPTMIAHKSVLQAKQHYVDDRIGSARTEEEKKEAAEEAEKIWQNPDLPFRTRATLTAVFVYLLAPIVLALVSWLLKR